MTSNFVNPKSLANTTMSIGILMLVLTAFVVIVRLFSNYHATVGSAGMIVLFHEDGAEEIEQ